MGESRCKKTRRSLKGYDAARGRERREGDRVGRCQVSKSRIQKSEFGMRPPARRGHRGHRGLRPGGKWESVDFGLQIEGTALEGDSTDR